MNDKNNLNSFFEKQENWDFVEPTIGHEKRFLAKLKKQQPKKKQNWIPIAIAASLVFGFGILYFNFTNPRTEKIVFSPQVQETHDYFSSVIKTELTHLKEKETPQNKVLIEDAMLQMNVLESDYEKLKVEILKNGENKQIIYAMITNMQTRISFIKSVLEQVESINKQKMTPNENNI
jgi:hypothetical protein